VSAPVGLDDDGDVILYAPGTPGTRRCHGFCDGWVSLELFYSAAENYCRSCKLDRAAARRKAAAPAAPTGRIQRRHHSSKAGTPPDWMLR